MHTVIRRKLTEIFRIHAVAEEAFVVFVPLLRDFSTVTIKQRETLFSERYIDTYF